MSSVHKSPSIQSALTVQVLLMMLQLTSFEVSTVFIHVPFTHISSVHIFTSSQSVLIAHDHGVVHAHSQLLPVYISLLVFGSLSSQTSPKLIPDGHAHVHSANPHPHTHGAVLFGSAAHISLQSNVPSPSVSIDVIPVFPHTHTLQLSIYALPFASPLQSSHVHSANPHPHAHGTVLFGSAAHISLQSNVPSPSVSVSASPHPHTNGFILFGSISHTSSQSGTQS